MRCDRDERGLNEISEAEVVIYACSIRISPVKSRFSDCRNSDFCALWGILLEFPQEEDRTGC